MISRTLFLSIFLLFSGISFSQHSLETNSFDEVEKVIASKVQEFGSKQVLVVLDIDNTVLTTTQDLGSDQWFTWQENGLKLEQCSFCVAKDFQGLLDIQEKLFVLGYQKPTESNLPELLKRIQNKEIKMILLTSRGSENRRATLRELSRYGYNFSDSKIGQDVGGTYLPYDLNNLAASGLSEEDRINLNISKPRPVSYTNGVYMTAGQHKGVMLRTLLAKFKQSYKAVVFVDDHLRHSVNMQKAFEGSDVDVTTFRYGGVDNLVEAFKKSDKMTVTAQWKILETTLDFIFVKP